MTEPIRNDKTRTRQQILNLLKREGALDSAQMATKLGVGTMAVRQHLYELQEQGMVTFHECANQECGNPVGRPAKQWQLTQAADVFFPTGYAELAINLLQAMKQAFGEEGLEKLLAIRMQQQIAAYQARINDADSLAQKLQTLAEIRSEEGYMATVLSEPNGEFLLAENHCPICNAAKNCVQLCNRELATFQTVLGDEVSVEREEYILAGGRRCAYRVVSKA